MTKHWTVLVTASLAALVALFAPTPFARADIFQWQYGFWGEYRPSAMLCPDGAGANAVPFANLSSRNLTKAYLLAANLPGANFTQANLTQAAFGFGSGGFYYQSGNLGATLTGANFSQANLTNADFSGYLGNDGEGDYYYLGADLTGANLVQANLTGANFYTATLTNANLSQTILNANFSGTTLTGANLTGADVRGANFSLAYVGHPYNAYLGGITLAQLYSTASYQAHELTGVILSGNSLNGWNFAGQNLTGAVLRNASLSNADFSNANLTDIDLKDSGLSNANLSGAEVRGATISSITAAQLYSTASYQDNDLKGINLDGNNLSGANLANQDLSGASFYRASLSNANFHQANLASANFTYPLASFPLGSHVATNLIGANLSLANLTNARFGGGEECQGEFCWFFEGANLSIANLSGADARNAYFHHASMIGTNTENMINPDGHIAGLDLTAGASLVVRDYDGGVPIVVDEHLAMDASGTLRLVFDADPWDSLISFAPGIPVTRGGTLDLTFAPGVNVATQSGRTIDLFDWTGVTPTGAFTVSSPYTWNFTNLYTTGEVTFLAAAGLPGDFNTDNVVDGADYVVWRKGLSTATYTQAAYNVWRGNFGTTLGAGSGAALPSATPLSPAVPEPATAVLLLFAAAGWRLRHRIRHVPISVPNSQPFSGMAPAFRKHISRSF